MKKKRPRIAGPLEELVPRRDWNEKPPDEMRPAEVVVGGEKL
jgi:hypothetical protein